MSASSKKKLRSEAAAEKLTERQEAEKKEQAKLKLYTGAFTAVLAILVVVAIVVGVTRTIEGSGIREKKTTAVTVGSHEISNAELSYYYVDAINNFRNNYGSYAFLYGLDTSLPLNEQFIDEEQTTTWADNFITSAVNSAQSTYAMVDAAAAEGYNLPDDQEAQISTLGSTLDTYATLSGMNSADDYVKAMYGKGASKESYLNYYRNNMLASAYYNAHQDSLSFTDEEIKAADTNAPASFSAYSYNQYYLGTSRFLNGGTTDADGNTTYSDEEQAAAVAAAEAAAKALASGTYADAAEFDAAIAAMEINADSSASSSAMVNQSYTSLNSTLADWISNASRKAGDTTYAASTYTSTDDNGNETETVNGYYVGYFVDASDNRFSLVNVRHILVTPEGGTTNENGSTVYSDEEKAAAKASAEELLAQWKAGEATEDSFAAMVAGNTDDTGSASNGGLYENVYPGQMVTAFNDWCFDSSRKAGDTGVVETEYGYHIMYFVDNSEMTYRNFLIENQLVSEAMENWYAAAIDALTVVEGNTQYIPKNITMGSNG